MCELNSQSVDPAPVKIRSPSRLFNLLIRLVQFNDAVWRAEVICRQIIWKGIYSQWSGRKAKWKAVWNTSGKSVLRPTLKHGETNRTPITAELVLSVSCFCLGVTLYLPFNGTLHVCLLYWLWPVARLWMSSACNQWCNTNPQ
jgi:hypothetical protein